MSNVAIRTVTPKAAAKSIKKAIKELGEKYRDLNNLEGEVNRLKGDIGLIQCYLERAVASVEGTPYEGLVET